MGRDLGLVLARQLAARRLVLGVGLVALTLVTPSPATSTTPPVGSASAFEAASPPPDERGRGTSQGSVRGFLEATTLHNYRRANTSFP